MGIVDGRGERVLGKAPIGKAVGGRNRVAAIDEDGIGQDLLDNGHVDLPGFAMAYAAFQGITEAAGDVSQTGRVAALACGGQGGGEAGAQERGDAAGLLLGEVPQGVLNDFEPDVGFRLGPV